MTAAPIIITADEINCLIYSYFQDSGNFHVFLLTSQRIVDHSFIRSPGFNHSAFALRNEGRLQNSPYFQKHIPRGELIDLLSKALLYLEVESHWRTDALATNCKAGFSLLEPHTCSLEEPSEKSPAPSDVHMEAANLSQLLADRTLTQAAAPPPSSPAKIPLPTRTGQTRPLETSTSRESVIDQDQIKPQTPSSVGPDTTAKRKTSPVPIEGHVEKRPRRMSTEMDIDSLPEGKLIPCFSKDMACQTFLYIVQIVTELSMPDAWETIAAKHPGSDKLNRAQGPGDSTTDPRVVQLLPGHKTEVEATLLGNLVHLLTFCKVFVCAFNPKMHNLLASGWVIALVFLPFTISWIDFVPSSSKDGVVNVWNLPDPPLPNSPDFATTPEEPVALENVSKVSQGDLTSLDWNSDGTLLAIGSYDSILRVCTSSGALYFSHPQHQVCACFLWHFCISD
jgi:transducin (beta)-like 1